MRLTGAGFTAAVPPVVQVDDLGNITESVEIRPHALMVETGTTVQHHKGRLLKGPPVVEAQPRADDLEEEPDSRSRSQDQKIPKFGSSTLHTRVLIIPLSRSKWR